MSKEFNYERYKLEIEAVLNTTSFNKKKVLEVI
jgi:hypothetical protein